MLCCLLQAFVAPLPVRALPGVGYKAEGLLKSWGVSTAAEARAISKQQLVKGLGDKHGELSLRTNQNVCCPSPARAVRRLYLATLHKGAVPSMSASLEDC